MNPGVRQLLLGGSQQWRNTLPAIRSFVTANYNQSNPHNQGAMASPPTVTVLAGGTAPVGVTNGLLCRDGTLTQVVYTGGFTKMFATDNRRAPCATISNTGGNASDGQQAIGWRAYTTSTEAKVAFRLQGSTTDYRFVVNDQYVSLAATSVPTGGGNYVTLDFGSAASRVVALEGQLTGAMIGIYTPTAGTLSKPTVPKRMIVLGDSFAEAIGATIRGDGFAFVAGDMLGIKDTWSSGVGGTGYVNRSVSDYYNLGQRLSDASANGPWDIVVVAMGLNDAVLIAGATLTAATLAGAVNSQLLQIRKANPAAQIFVVGAWDVAAPGAPAADYVTTKAAIRAGIPSGQGFTFLDPEGVTYTKSDTVHPDTAGHATLGAWLALQIKTALGA